MNQFLILFGCDVNSGYRNVDRFTESVIEAVGAIEKQRAALLARLQALNTQSRATGLSTDEQQKFQTETKQTEQELKRVNGVLWGSASCCWAGQPSPTAAGRARGRQ